MSHLTLSGPGRPVRVVALALILGAAAHPLDGPRAPPEEQAPRVEERAARMTVAAPAALPAPGDQADRVPPPAPGDDETPARLTLGPGGRDLHLTGDLSEGVAARVAQVLAAHSRVERLHLTSDGGLVEEASSLAGIVTARRLSTVVRDICVSACTLVFVHGRRRYLLAGGRLGFHAPYEVGPDGGMQAVDPAPERAAYTAAGVPPAFVARAMAVAPADIWIPSIAELRMAGVVTAVVGRGRFPETGRDVTAPLVGRQAAGPSKRRALRASAASGRAGRPAGDRSRDPA